MSIIRLEDVTHAYAGENILENINLVIDNNSRYGLIGPNGCGKTTLMKIITGELSPSDGEGCCAKLCTTTNTNSIEIKPSIVFID